MKQFIIHLLTGKPRKGQPVKYLNDVHIKQTSVPFNVSFDIWQQAVKEHGYQKVIQFFQQLYN